MTAPGCGSEAQEKCNKFATRDIGPNQKKIAALGGQSLCWTNNGQNNKARAHADASAQSRVGRNTCMNGNAIPMNIELQSMAIEMPPVAAHPNRAPFRGVLTFVDTA